MHHVSKVVAASLAAIETRHQMRDKDPTISTGFTDLDCITAGLQPGSLVLIGGRPSVGASALALNVIQHVAKSDHVAGIVSCEIDVEPLLQRIILCSACVSSATIFRGYPTHADWSNISVAAEDLENAPLYIEFAVSVQAALHSIELLKVAKTDLAVVLVDGLDCIVGNAQEREQACRILRQLALSLGLCIIVTLHVSHACESRKNKRPLLCDLRESEFGDVVLFVHRDDYYQYTLAPSDRAELIVARNKLGPAGCIELNYDRNLGRFSDRVSRR